MKYKTQNGWTKEKMIAAIQTRMLDHKSKGMSVYEGPTCLYLTPDGNRCAVGVFIPEGHEAELNLHSVEGLLFDFPELLKTMPLGLNGLDAIQHIHDSIYYPDTEDPRPRLIEWINNNVEDAI